MIISTHTITEEYCDGTLVIYVLETDRGGTKFSTVSAAQEIISRLSTVVRSYIYAFLKLSTHSQIYEVKHYCAFFGGLAVSWLGETLIALCRVFTTSVNLD